MSNAELDQPTRDLNRREFARASVGVGFAAATLPIAAQTEVKTDSAGLTVGEVLIPVGGFKLPAYRAQPADKSNLPVVLVVSEIFGVHEHIADVARRFADPTSYGEIAKLMAEVVSQAPDAQVMGDLDACAAWARTQGGDVSRLGVTGFCWGGRITWLYAAHNPGLKAGVAWYGRLTSPATLLQPQRPVDLAVRLHAPVLGLYGGKDDGIPLESVEQMKAALAKGSAAAQRSQFHLYPDAPHAFHADYRPSFRAAEAQDGWKRCIAWFQQHGVA
jgi:carboxymethylenebutenolidase